MDDSFSTSASLEVFSIDHYTNHRALSSSDDDDDQNFGEEENAKSANNDGYCEVVGTGCAVAERFHRLCWNDQVSERTPRGILAGGLADGTVQLYDPNALMSRTTTARKMNNSRKNKTNQEGQDDGFASSFTNNIGADDAEDLPQASATCVLTTLQNAHNTIPNLTRFLM